MYFTVEISEKSDSYIAKCLELDLCGYGSSKDQAMERLHQIINFYAQAADEFMPEEAKNPGKEDIN